MDLLQYFPYSEPREIQSEALRILGATWNDYDIHVISAPTAFGKSAVAKTLMRAFRSVSVITPTNLLVDQFRQEFPDTPTLARLDSYHCPVWKRPCSVTRGKCRSFCSRKKDGVQCPASGDLATSKYQRGPGIYNYYTYLSQRIYRDVLVVDEAHNLLPTIRERLALRMWQHDWKYPNRMWSSEQMREWVQSLPPAKQKRKTAEILKEAVSYKVPRYIAQRTREWFNGKGTLRGEPELRDCIKLLPVDISDAPPMFWPYKEVKKIVLLSATIGPKDIEGLFGLGGGGRRVQFLDCKSPIPPERRPIVAENLVSVNRGNMDQAVELIASRIEALAARHEGEKGIVHATYQMAEALSHRLQGSRYLYHDRTNKKEQYELFRRSPPAAGRILVACGMYEGIDLPEDLGRWQVLSKIPWQSLGNPAIRHLSELDPEWYLWETVKTVIQACGRICRTPEDYGITYILDGTFQRILREARYMLPDWYLDALTIVGEDT